MIKELYKYRQLLKSNVRKEIRGKYKGSFLGVLWSFVNPLLQVLVYAIVFPYIMRIKTDNYLVFLIIGIIYLIYLIIKKKDNYILIYSLFFSVVSLPIIDY